MAKSQSTSEEGASPRGSSFFEFLYSARSVGQRGQILVEYILLLFVVIMAAATIMRSVVGGSEDSPGFLLSRWIEMMDAVARDPAGESETLPD